MFKASNLFERELEKRIKIEMERVVNDLSMGYVVKEYATYTKLVGYLEALRWITETALEEVAQTVHERTM